MQKDEQLRLVKILMKNLRVKIGAKLLKDEVQDFGLAGISIILTLSDPRLEQFTVSASILPSHNEKDILAEVQNLIDLVTGPDLEVKIQQAMQAGDLTGADTVFANDDPNVSMVAAFAKFAAKGIEMPEVMELVRRAQSDTALFNRLNAFLDEGKDDDFSDVLGKKTKMKKRGLKKGKNNRLH